MPDPEKRLTPDRKLNADDVAEACGVSRQTIQTWYNEGLTRSPKWQQLAAFLMERLKASATGSKRNQLASAQAEKIELENARRRGQLAEVSDVEGMLTTMAATLVGRLEAIPGRMANELAAISDAGVIRQRLLSEVRAVRIAVADCVHEVQASEPAAPKRPRKSG